MAAPEPDRIVAPAPSMPRAGLVPDWLDPGRDDERLRLHVGGWEARPGWKILDLRDGPDVDFRGDLRNLTQFPDNAASAVYASHVLEHVSHREELPAVLTEIRRILASDGVFLMSVPDLEVLCELFLDKSMDLHERLRLMSMMYGGQFDEHDFHKVGLWRDYLAALLVHAGFRRVDQVQGFGIFQDSSLIRVRDRLISLNLIVT